MSTHHYQDRLQPNQISENYQHMEWGTSHHPSRPASHSNSNLQQHIRYNTDHYQHTPEEPFVVNVDYSQVAAVETGFKKLKSNQIQILKELKREYQVLRNTELESGMVLPHRPPTESVESMDEYSSKSISDVQSSSFSRADKTRKKSQNKQIQVAAIERKQMEMMLNNSMKKIEQLLSTEIDLKRTVTELRNKLESRDQHEEDHQYALKKYRQDVEILTRSLDDSKRQCDSVKSKSKETIHSIGSLEGQIAVNQIQLKKKEERIRIIEEEVYLQRNKLCTVELDMKKYKLQAEMLERNHKEELSLFQRRLANIESEHLVEKQDEIRKLKHENELKDERYKMVLEHLNKQKEEKDELCKKQELTKDSSNDKEYIKQLQDLVEALKGEKEKKSNESQDVLSSILEKMSTINSQSNQDLVNEIYSLKRQLEIVNSSVPQNNADQENLQQKIRQLERSIQEQNLEKMYFFEDLKKLKDQLVEQKKIKENAIFQANNFRQTLKKVEEEASKYSYELETLRHLKQQNMSENETKTRDVMFKSQLLQNKEIEIAQVREEMNEIIDNHRNQIKQYEEELKILKRKLAEEEIKNYKIKEELELKLCLSKTEYEAELTRNQEDLDKVKKNNADEYNNYFSHKMSLEDKLVEKDQEISRLQTQLNEYTKEKDSFYEVYKLQQDKKVQSIQEDHTNNVNQLASRLEGLAEINTQHMKLIQRNTWLEHETSDMRRILHTNRTVNQGVDHLWSVKEAEYSNIDQILKAMQ